MSITYNYYQNIEGETISKEYKLFTFGHAGIPLPQRELEDLIRSGLWIFNQIVKTNLIKYLRIYLPKYTCAFMHQETETLTSELYIGVDDYGNIMGIPYKDDLDISFINDTIIDILTSDLIIIEEEINIMDYISFEIIPVEYEYDEEYILWEEYSEHKTEYSTIMKKYLKDKKKWNDTLMYYTRKLSVLINDEMCRKEIVEYIIENSDDYIDDYETEICGIIELLNSDEYINVNTDYIEIHTLKQIPDNILFWLTRWKDYIIDKHRRTKPKNININKIDPYPYICRIEQMIPYWFKMNTDMKLCIIKFNFRKPEIKLNISYKDLLGRISSCYRGTSKCGPCCIPL